MFTGYVYTVMQTEGEGGGTLGFLLPPPICLK